jgi:hypothetical protein
MEGVSKMVRALKSRIVSFQLAYLCLLAGECVPANAQTPLLKGLIGVRVSVVWTGGAATDRDAIQSDVELKLRQAGMYVDAPQGSQAPPLFPLLFIGVGGIGAAGPVTVEFHESVYVCRDYFPMMKLTATNAYAEWFMARKKEPTPITEEEHQEHMAPVLAEGAENSHLAPPPPRDATTWERHGIAQAVQPESVKDIIARYAQHPYWQTPAGRPIVQHWMDLEVQAAMAEAQRPVGLNTVRDAINGFVDQFLNEWLTPNPREREGGGKL